jgi:hypothetical protein
MIFPICSLFKEHLHASRDYQGHSSKIWGPVSGYPSPTKIKSLCNSWTVQPIFHCPEEAAKNHIILDFIFRSSFTIQKFNKNSFTKSITEKKATDRWTCTSMLASYIHFHINTRSVQPTFKLGMLECKQYMRLGIMNTKLDTTEANISELQVKYIPL